MNKIKTNFSKTAIIVHGTSDYEEFSDDMRASSSNSHWLPWLQNKLLINGYLTQTPEMPTAYYPNYEEWKKMFELFFINEESLLVGHSCGAGFLLRWLSENKVKLKKLVLVAPWLDPFNEKDSNFFRFDIDPDILERMKVTIFMSDNDMADINESLNIINKVFKDYNHILMEGFGHFCFNDMNTREFPEILSELLK